MPRQPLRAGAGARARRGSADPSTSSDSSAPSAARVARAAIRGCRPRQATKNLLVLTAPALGGQLLTDTSVLRGALVALVAFCAVGAAVYLANDLRDVASDRCHPVKRHRPIASGELSARTAALLSAVLGLLGLGLALWWSVGLALVLAAYLGVQVAYALVLKHRPGLDLLAVASGFVLRVVAGGVGAGVELSTPFLVVVGFAALFMVAGKRYSEMRTLGAAAGTRRSLAGYSLRWLRGLWVAAATVAVVGYAAAAGGAAPAGSAAAAWSLASVPLFAAGVGRYARHVRRGEAGCPEAVVFGDRVLQALGAVWVATLATSVGLA